MCFLRVLWKYFTLKTWNESQKIIIFILLYSFCEQMDTEERMSRHREDKNKIWIHIGDQCTSIHIFFLSVTWVLLSTIPMQLFHSCHKDSNTLSIYFVLAQSIPLYLSKILTTTTGKHKGNLVTNLQEKWSSNINISKTNLKIKNGLTKSRLIISI